MKTAQDILCNIYPDPCHQVHLYGECQSGHQYAACECGWQSSPGSRDAVGVTSFHHIMSVIKENILTGGQKGGWCI